MKDGGFRRPFVGMAAALLTSLGGMSQIGVLAIEQPKLARKGKERKRTNSSTNQEKHGGRECARRVRQMGTGKTSYGEIVGYGQGGDRSQYDDYEIASYVPWHQFRGCKCGLPKNHWKGKF